MRKIDVLFVEKQVEKLFIEANYNLPNDVKKKLDEAIQKEDSPIPKNILKILQEIIKNLKI